MTELDVWKQGHSTGINLAVKMINDWCHLECKTIVEVIQEIKKLQGDTDDQS